MSDFRERQRRLRRRVALACLAVSLCGYALVRIWISTEVAAVGARITHLERRNQQLATDLTVARAKLAQRVPYGDLLRPAAEAGFRPQGERRLIRVMVEPPPETPRLWTQVGAELRAGSRLILSEALAHDRRAGARSRGERP